MFLFISPLLYFVFSPFDYFVVIFVLTFFLDSIFSGFAHDSPCDYRLSKMGDILDTLFIDLCYLTAVTLETLIFILKQN